MDKLILSWQEDDGERTYTIETGESNVTVGRGTDRDVTVGEPTVSRHHATIFIQHDQYHIRNESSTNPIVLYVESQATQIPPGGTSSLNEVNRLMIGRLTVHLARETVERQLEMKIKCPTCGRLVDEAKLDCPWCGSSLAAGASVYIEIDGLDD